MAPRAGQDEDEQTLLAQTRRRDAGAFAALYDRYGAAVYSLALRMLRDRQTAETLVEACWLWYRDLLCAQVGADARLAVFAEAVGRKPAGRSLEQLLSGLAACREAWQALRGNVSPRLTVEVLLSRLALKAA